MQIGCHASVFTGVFDESGLRRSISGTAEAGFDLIELPILTPYQWNVPLTRKLLDEYDISVTGSLGLSERVDISSEDPNVVQAGERYLTKALEVLSELGATHLVGVTYGAMKKHMRPATEAEVRAGQEVLHRLAHRAAELDISLGLEVVNRYESNILNTAKQARGYLDGVNAPNIGVHLDTYHMHIEESGLFAPVLESSQRLSYAHIGESHRGYLGSGSVDFGSFFRALKQVNFDGPVVFESFSSTVVSPELTGTLGIWRNLWDDSDDLAQHANSFIRNQLRAVDTINLH